MLSSHQYELTVRHLRVLSSFVKTATNMPVLRQGRPGRVEPPGHAARPHRQPPSYSGDRSGLISKEAAMTQPTLYLGAPRPPPPLQASTRSMPRSESAVLSSQQSSHRTAPTPLASSSSNPHSRSESSFFMTQHHPPHMQTKRKPTGMRFAPHLSSRQVGLEMHELGHPEHRPWHQYETRAFRQPGFNPQLLGAAGGVQTYSPNSWTSEHLINSQRSPVSETTNQLTWSPSADDPRRRQRILRRPQSAAALLTAAGGPPSPAYRSAPYLAPRASVSGSGVIVA